MKALFATAGACLGLMALFGPARALAQLDELPPVVLSHSASGLVGQGAGDARILRVSVLFNERISEDSVLDPGLYAFAGATVQEVQLTPNKRKLILSVTPAPAPGSAYSLTVPNVTDLAGNVLESVTLAGTTPAFYELDWAIGGIATQSSELANGEGVAGLAADGDTDGFYDNGSVTINRFAEEGWWEVDLNQTRPIGRVKVWFRTLTSGECQALFNSCAVRNDDFTLKILDENLQVVWARTYPARPPLEVAYNLPPGVTGRYVRFESQSPLTSSDGFFSLAEVGVIAPYENATVTLTKDLAATSTITENRRLLLGPVAAAVDGVPVQQLTYQWQENGVDIVGANGPSYQTPPLSLGGNTRYRVNALLSGKVAASTETVVTVEADTVAPTIKTVTGGFLYTDVTVVFSEPVSEATAGDLGNYALSGDLVITELTVLTPTSVRLTTTPQTAGAKYTLTVNRIRDLASGLGNVIAADSKRDYIAPQAEGNKFVVIGDVANPKDTQWNTARGAVGYTYEIYKYKVRNSEYAAFLNSKAKTDPNNLMVSGGGEIIREGEDGSYTYSVLEGRENRPVVYVAAVDAMRMANWLSNGGTDESDTETGSYTFSGYDVVSKRNANADYFLPNDDEWYKAAYYDPTKNGTGGYWQFPPKTDDPAKMVSELPVGGPFSANFNNVAAGPDNNTATTDVGAYTAAFSYYGTFDQAGLTWEWNEPQDPTTKVSSRRGGSQGNAVARLAAGVNANNGINKGGATVNQGFRLARAHRIRLPLVAVGNPGNPKDTQWNTVRGQVNYPYQISKYKVSNADYAVFLNSKAKTDPNNLMVSGGGEIIREGEDGSYTYRVLEGRENRPVVYVAAVDAMRMANWLHNGGTDESDTETGSYTFSGYDVVSKRTPGATYVLPNDDEWYKAAYYDPTKNGTGGYWQFPPKTDDPAKMVSELPVGGPFSANFNNVAAGPDNNTATTDVGAYTAAFSYYGTFDQAGLTWEWNEPQDPTTKVSSRRGGSQGNAVARLAAGVNANNGINKGGATVNQGFRLALVPPSPERPQLTIVHVTATTIRITWAGNGVLHSASSVNGPWAPVDGNATSPYLVNPTGLSKYYRVIE